MVVTLLDVNNHWPVSLSEYSRWMEYPEDAGIPHLLDSTFLGNEENIPEIFVHGYLEASDHEQHFKG